MDDGVGERADAVYFDTHGVAGLEPAGRIGRHADSVRGAGEDDESWQERRAATEKLDDRGDIEDHIVGIPVLHGLAVENRADAKLVGIWNFIRRHKAGPERREGVEGFSMTPLAAAEILLPIAGTDIIRTGIAEHEIESVGSCGVLAFFPNDDGEFAFVVDLVAGEGCGNLYGSPGCCKAPGDFMKSTGWPGIREPVSSAWRR